MDGMDSAWIGRLAGLLLVVACNNDDTTATGDEDSSGGSESSMGSSGSDEPDTGDDPDTSGGTDPDDGASSDESSTGELPDVDPTPASAGIAAGAAWTCSVDDGVLTCWGANNCGQLGDGTRLSKAPVVVAPDRTWASVAAGGEHTCAIDDDQGLWCWGNGFDGKLGDGELHEEIPFTNACVLEPFAVAEGTAWARVALGDDHTCGVQTDGTLWCWGSNESGQIGDGAVGPLYTRLVPTEVGGSAWIDVYAGEDHSCALRSDATVWCWGVGLAFGDSEVLFSSTPVEVALPGPMRALARGGTAKHTCAIAEDDSVWCWGANDGMSLGPEDTMGAPVEIDVGGPADEVAVRAGRTCVRRTDGTMHCLGVGSSGQLGDGIAEPGHFSGVAHQVPIDASIDTIAVGDRHSCARTDDGTALCWGSNDAGEIGDGTSGPDNARLVPTPAIPWGGGPIATGWTDAALGSTTACGLREGAPWCWGSRAAGGLGNDDDIECPVSNPTECSLTTPVEVAGTGVFSALTVGSSFACALRDDGTLWCWGSNELGQLGNDDEAALVPVQVGAENDWTDVDVGGDTSCGLRSPGTLWCWGDDEFGELGDGTAGEFSTTPTQVGADADWIDVVVGVHHVCGLRAGGTLACWGHNLHGQLGIGAESEEPMPSPSVVAGTWTSVAIGRSHTCAVADDGTAWCWGLNIDGDVDPAGPGIVPAPVQVGVDANWQSLALGESFTCGLRTDGTAWCWGSNSSGQIGNGEVLSDSDAFVDEPTMVADIDDWLAITADNSTACGVRSDATVLCWGQNAYGQQGNDTIFTSGVPREVRDDG